MPPVTPDQAQTLLNEAEATLQTGDAQRADALFNTVLAAEGLDAHQKAQAEGGLGEAALLSKKPAEAAGHFHRAAHLDPGSSAFFHYRLGEARMKAGAWEQAVQAFQESFQAYPEEERHARAEVLGRLGRARVLAGDRGGETDIRQAIDLDPIHAALHADLGDCLLERRAFAEAREAYARAAELEPRHADYRAARDRATALLESLAKRPPPP